MWRRLLCACAGAALLAAPGLSQTLREAAAGRGIYVGTAVAGRALAGEPRYREVLAREYNQAQCENEMKFAALHPAPETYRFEAGDALAEFAAKNGMRLRGHTLVWHQALPGWVREAGSDPAKMAAILREHITTAARHYAGKVAAWDVINEAFNKDGSLRGTPWYDKPGIGRAGTGYIEQALRWARAADPKAQLFYNEFDTENINAKSNAVLEMVKDFRARGVPLDGVGFQMHIKSGADLKDFAANLKRFTDAGVTVEITELDVRIPLEAREEDLGRQAATYREVFAACVATPGCKAVQTWGFTDAHSWVPRFFKGYGAALPLDERYEPKPAYFAIRDALGKR